MIHSALRTCGLALVLVPTVAPPVARADALQRPVALAAAPARLMLAGHGEGAIRVTNTGTKPLVVDVARAGFALDLRGRPRVVGRARARSAARWLSLRPSRFALGPRDSASVFVVSNPPGRAEPGDHDALVLLSARRLANDSRVTVRAQLGVVVVVRAAGVLVRHLAFAGIQVAKRGRERMLRVEIVNRGNVGEWLQRPRATIAAAPRGRLLGTLVASSREVRPRTRTIVEFRLGGAIRGRTSVRVVVAAAPGRRRLERTFRLRL